jgi:outer membrane protein assembly factor BamB
MKNTRKPLFILWLLLCIGASVSAERRIEWESLLPEERAEVLFVEENRLYAFGGPYSIPYSTLYCLDTKTGEIIWRFHIEVSEDVFEPFLYRDNIYWGTESGALYALGKYDGALRWAFALEGKYRVKNVRYRGKFLLHDRNEEIVFLDLLQGDITSEYKNPDLRWHNTVQVWNYLFYVNDSRDLVCIHAGTGRMIWKIRQNVKTGPFQGKEAVYYGSDLETLFCLHPLNGVRKWVSIWFPEQLYEEGEITAVQSGKNRVLLLETSTGELRWDFSLPYQITGLRIYRGKVIAADIITREVYIFDGESGEPVFVYQIPGASDFNVIVKDRWLYVGNYEGRILKVDRGTE